MGASPLTLWACALPLQGNAGLCLGPRLSRHGSSYLSVLLFTLRSVRIRPLLRFLQALPQGLCDVFLKHVVTGAAAAAHRTALPGPLKLHTVRYHTLRHWIDSHSVMECMGIRGCTVLADLLLCSYLHACSPHSCKRRRGVAIHKQVRRGGSTIGREVKNT